MRITTRFILDLYRARTCINTGQSTTNLIMRKTIIDSILAGICISLGGVAFLKVGGIIGATLFSFGLITVVCYKMKLYTGVSGFVETRRDWIELPVIITGNIVGCALVALAIKTTTPELVDSAHKIVEGRLDKGFWNVLLLAVFCGFIMTTVVNFARQKMWLPLLFGIPLFIMCGFVHSIADAFYYTLALNLGEWNGQAIVVYLASIIGNFIGCNLYRTMQLAAPKPKQ